MSYRRRHRWFRRMAFGLAFASVMFAGRVSVAAAVLDEGADGSRYVTVGGWSGLVDPQSGIPLSAGIPHGDEAYLNEQRAQVIPYLSHGIVTEADAQAAAAEAIHDPYLTDIAAEQAQVEAAAVRPDDLANRFAHSDVATRPELVSSGGSTFEWNDALTLGIGALVLALGLGLALGYLCRPRLAGL